MGVAMREIHYCSKHRSKKFKKIKLNSLALYTTNWYRNDVPNRRD